MAARKYSSNAQLALRGLGESNVQWKRTETRKENYIPLSEVNAMLILNVYGMAKMGLCLSIFG